jgi:hypothetical protein
LFAWPFGWKCIGPYGDDRERSSKLDEDLGKAKYIKLTDDEKLLDAQIFDQICASDNASIKELRKLTRFSNVAVCSLKKWRTELLADKANPAIVNNIIARHYLHVMS